MHDNLEYELKALIKLSNSRDQLEHVHKLYEAVAYRLNDDEKATIVKAIDEADAHLKMVFDTWITELFRLRKNYGIHNHIQPTTTIRVYEPAESNPTTTN